MDEAGQDYYGNTRRLWDSTRPVHGQLDMSAFERIADEVRMHLRPGPGRLLDMGCGTGHVVHLMARDGFDAYGFDFAPAKVEMAAALNPGRVWAQSFLDPFASGPYDRIISYAVVQYCRPADMPKLIHNTLDALTVGGQALHLAVPIFELYQFANGVYIDADTEPQMDHWRHQLMKGAIEGKSYAEDGTFFHSVEKVREIVTALGHGFTAHPSRTKYRLEFEIQRRH